MTLVPLGDRHDEAEVRVDHPLLRGEVALLDALREMNLVGGGQQLVPARGVHEQLQRIERAAHVSGRDRARLLRRLVAHDDIALFERGAESREVVLGQLVLVRQSLDVLLLDEPALGGLLEQTLGR